MRVSYFGINSRISQLCTHIARRVIIWRSKSLNIAVIVLRSRTVSRGCIRKEPKFAFIKFLSFCQ